ncbi:tRNA lysidine(34) synthetase TilS [Myxococcota bacterium]|nr:tRNA lysidine(34) synthetase TilS [Myxococcota bacterium]
MDRAALHQLLARTRSRGQVKALGARVDGDPALRAALVALVAERGEADEALDLLPGKVLVRRALDRQDAAQVRTNPIHRDEAFTCAWCGAAVEPGGAMVRDHCPYCLRSLHVDVVPGDRAAGCGGLLEPVSLELVGGQVHVHHRCARCGHRHRVRAHPQDEVPAGLSVAELPGRGALRAQGRARTLPARLLEAVRRQELWRPGDRVLVAVSGGLDSTVLLELLWRTQEGHGARLEGMSLDHGLRPEASQEVATVAQHCARLDVPFHTARLHLSPGGDLARRARQARQAALLAVGADRIATAHHQDDQAETVLQRLVSGSGGAGLAAMQPLSPPWCRPLLAEPRTVLRAWAEAEGLSWVEDPSNPDSERGRLRALLDGLGDLREGAVAGLARSAGLLAREDALLEELLEGAWPALVEAGGLRIAGLRALHPALQARAVRRLCLAAGVVPRADAVERLLRAAQAGGPDRGRPWRLELGQGWCLRVDEGRLGVEGPLVAVGPEPDQQSR